MLTSHVGLAALAPAALFIAAMPLASAQSGPYPVPKNAGDPATLGLGIQRTMALLAGSTPKHRNTVKVLFYGQSITEQAWWRSVADDLKRRFPNANLMVENRALGGFSSQLLWRTAPADVYPFSPDLVIFHVYGAHTNYEDLMRGIREHTTAEVLIQTDHVTQDSDLNEETDPAKLSADGKVWNSFMNYQFLPGIAKKYGTGLVDQRNLWKQYLKENNLHASQLLRDGVHQNDFGNYLMAELVKPYLVRRTDTKIDPMNCGMVRTYVIGRDVKAKDGRLQLELDGNRVDLISRAAGGPASQILIDGKKPSEIPELYVFTPALSTPGGKWPVILKVGHEKPLQVEDWTLEATRDATKEDLFTFTLTGSKTGPDGSGRSDQRFVSNSGRVVIDPADWNVKYSLALPGITPVPPKITVRWEVLPQYQDELIPTATADPSVEQVVTVAQGLVNGPHTLEVVGPATALVAIRIYRPPYRDGQLISAALPARAPKGRVIHIVPIGDSITQGGREGRPEYSYRYPLYYMLRDAGYNVDFVGSLRTGLNAGFVWPAKDGVPFDPDHEGHYGWKTAAVRDNLRKWMQTYPAAPDIALIHLGSNDQGSKDFQADIANPLKDMVAMLREKNPRVVVLLAHLDFNGGAALQIRPVVEQVARELSTKQSPVLTVPMYEGWHEDPAAADTDTFDWAHPNEQGQRKMASKWLAAMRPYLDRLQRSR